MLAFCAPLCPAAIIEVEPSCTIFVPDGYALKLSFPAKGVIFRSPEGDSISFHDPRTVPVGHSTPNRDLIEKSKRGKFEVERFRIQSGDQGFEYVTLRGEKVLIMLTAGAIAHFPDILDGCDE